MHKGSITWRALKRYHSYNRKYFPLKCLHMLFENLSPYFNLWISAEIVTALHAEMHAVAPREKVFMLVAAALFGNLFIHIMGMFLSRCVDVELKVLNNNESAAFHHKTISLDYDTLEDPAVRMLRRKIKENAYINNYGVIAMRYAMEGLIRCCIGTVFALVLFAEMFADILHAGFQMESVLLLIGMIGSAAISVCYSNFTRKHAAARDKALGDLLLRENQLGRGHSLNGTDARIYKQQEIISRLEQKSNEDHLRLFSKSRWHAWLLDSPYALLSRLPEICAYLIVCFYCVRGYFPVGGVIKYVGCLEHLILNIFDLNLRLSVLKNNEPFLEPYLEYFDIPNAMYQGSLAVEKRSDRKFDIEFRNVSFRYAGAEEYALRKINLSLKVGERLAVVGMNGSGKTTFIKLLCRLYDPTEGEIFMNDFNIRKYDYREYLNLFSVVFQDHTLLALPLGSNIACGKTWNTEKAERLIEEVGLGARYAEMTKKLDTPLYRNFDEDGVNISGGEAQKIALARALYRDAPFIILDEPTAALDPIAEAEIYAKFDSIVGDKTAIYISHRLSSCRFCDRIAVFDHGEIVQVGTHEDLLTDVRGKYHELWYAQAQYYARKGEA